MFLGWSRRIADFEVYKRPGITVYDQSGKHLEDAWPDVVWHGRSENLLYPVVAEVYVGRLLDRDEFRRHCDTHRTHSAILAQLR